MAFHEVTVIKLTLYFKDGGLTQYTLPLTKDSHHCHRITVDHTTDNVSISKNNFLKLLRELPHPFSKPIKATYNLSFPYTFPSYISMQKSDLHILYPTVIHPAPYLPLPQFSPSLSPVHHNYSSHSIITPTFQSSGTVSFNHVSQHIFQSCLVSVLHI